MKNLSQGRVWRRRGDVERFVDMYVVVVIAGGSGVSRVVAMRGATVGRRDALERARFGDLDRRERQEAERHAARREARGRSCSPRARAYPRARVDERHVRTALATALRRHRHRRSARA